MVIDVRVNDAYSNQEIAAILAREITLYKNYSKKFTIKLLCNCLNHDLVKAGIAMGRETYGSPTLSDQAVLSCQSLKLGPGDSTRSHSANEFIYVLKLKKEYKFILNY